MRAPLPRSLTPDVPPVPPLSAHKCPLIASSLHSSRFIRPRCVTGQHSHVQPAAHEAKGLSAENNQSRRESKLPSVSSATQSRGAGVALTTSTPLSTRTPPLFFSRTADRPDLNCRMSKQSLLRIRHEKRNSRGAAKGFKNSAVDPQPCLPTTLLMELPQTADKT